MSIRSSGGIVHDSVSRAPDGGITETPQLVVTGIDVGQNLDALADQGSGTVGAARAAARGIPALATAYNNGFVTLSAPPPLAPAV